MKQHLEASADPQGARPLWVGQYALPRGTLVQGLSAHWRCAPPFPGKWTAEAGSGWVWEWSQGRLRRDCFGGVFSCLFFVIAIGSQHSGGGVGAVWTDLPTSSF